MTIGAHIPSGKINGLLHISILTIAKKNPQHHFILFTETKGLSFPANCTPVIIAPKQGSKLLRHYWYSYKLPALLTRYAVDVFISAAGMTSLRSAVPQYLLFENDITVKEKKLKGYYRKIFHAGLLKAKGIFTAEDIFRDNAVRLLPGCEKKINAVYYGIGEAAANIGYDEREIIKEKYAKGHEFFLFPVTASSAPYLINLLKAFSRLKKWQHSSMKLILLLQNIGEEGLIKDFKNYRHREDIFFVKDENNIASEILGAAYGLVFFDAYSTGNIGLKAMQSGIPVIAQENILNESTFGIAAMFTSSDAGQLGEKMMKLYKDEYERAAMIENGKAVTAKYNAEAAADKIWTLITGE